MCKTRHTNKIVHINKINRKTIEINIIKIEIMYEIGIICASKIVLLLWPSSFWAV